MARKYHERRSLATDLLTWLQAKGWNISEVREGFISDATVKPPMVSVYFLPNRFIERQMGRDKKAFSRRVQIDALMESEPRADAISDDIADFIDETNISVKDENDNSIALMACYDSESILIDIEPPIFDDPASLRWRAIVKSSYEVDYLV